MNIQHAVHAFEEVLITSTQGGRLDSVQFCRLNLVLRESGTQHFLEISCPWKCQFISFICARSLYVINLSKTTLEGPAIAETGFNVALLTPGFY